MASVLTTIDSLDERNGGTTVAVLGYCRAVVSCKEWSVDLLAIGNDCEGWQKDYTETEGRVHIVPPFMSFGFFGKVSFRYSAVARRIIEDKQISLIHDHGLWLPSNYSSFCLAEKYQIPRVVSIHGMLEPWALNVGQIKKSVAWKIWVKRSLDSASLIHVTSYQEAESIRALGIKIKIAVVPVGIDFPQKLEKKTRNCGRRVLLYLSRIHPKKGLDILIEAWKSIRPRGWKVVVAGTGDFRYLCQIRDKIEKYKIEEDFEFIGPVYGDDKAKIFRNADLFVLPTRSENFGIVIGEALSYGVPVVTTMNAPWKDLEEYKCGWWIHGDVFSLINVLSQAVRLKESDFEVMSHNARQLIIDCYSWDSIKVKTIEMYEYLMGETDRPDFIV